jgi:hypothetical protein
MKKYQEVLNNEGKQMKTSFSHSILNKKRVLSRLFLAHLFQEHGRAMAFLQENRLVEQHAVSKVCKSNENMQNPMWC